MDDGVLSRQDDLPRRSRRNLHSQSPPITDADPGDVAIERFTVKNEGEEEP